MPATSFSDSYLKRWERIHQQSQRIVAVTPNDKYDWKPCASAMSLGELVNHLWISEAGLIEAASNGAFPKQWAAPLNDTAAVVAASDESHAAAVAKVAALTPEQLAETITPFGPQAKMTRQTMLEMVLEHEVHHRGQLYTFLRIAGCEVPPLYGKETIHEFADGE